jgi:hypothetical protein
MEKILKSPVFLRWRRKPGGDSSSGFCGRVLKKLFLPFTFLLSTACAKNFNFMTNDINKLASKQDVEAVLGRSEEKKIYQNKEILVYYLHNSLFDMILSKNFPFVGFFPLVRTGKEFWIALENERVVAMGYIDNFGYRLDGTTR